MRASVNYRNTAFSVKNTQTTSSLRMKIIRFLIALETCGSIIKFRIRLFFQIITYLNSNLGLK
jgi:hypothetical protein